MGDSAAATRGLDGLRDELTLAWARLREEGVRRRFRDARGLSVALGERPSDSGGWLTLGLAPAPGVDRVFDFRKVLPFSDGAVRRIACAEVFERIDYTEELPYFLSECHRVLESGGTLRIHCRDGARFVRAYHGESVEALRRLVVETGAAAAGLTRMELLNVALRGTMRRSALYDHETLEFLLLRYGFGDLRRLDRDRDGHAAAVIEIEAIK